jgi:hypothetical protein
MSESEVFNSNLKPRYGTVQTRYGTDTVTNSDALLYADIYGVLLKLLKNG